MRKVRNSASSGGFAPPPDVPLTDPALVAGALKSADALVKATALQLAPPAADELSRCFTNTANYSHAGFSIFIRNASPECAHR